MPPVSHRDIGGGIVKGKTWNESEVFEDPVTLRRVRRVTKYGQHNNTATYHTGASWSADGDDFVFTSARSGRSFLARCHAPTGEITCLTEPVDGVGHRAELHCADLLRGMVGNGKGVCMCSLLAPKSRWAVYSYNRTVAAVHIDTLEERTLIADCGPEVLVHPACLTPDETGLILERRPANPELLAGGMRTKEYADCFPDGRIRSEILRMPLAGGEIETLFADDEMMPGHIQCCPTDGDLLLLDRNLPHGAPADYATRCWSLRLSTGKMVPLPPRNKERFQVHSTWTWDGRHVIYHGGADGGGWYIGLVEPDGTIYREYLFPKAEHYGHVSAAADRPAIILDGNLTEDLLVWLYYDAPSPRVEVIARHDTWIRSIPGQFGHAHPQSNPTGKYISFNCARHVWMERGKSDVYVVEVE
jgi:hypothetical protein